MRSVCCAPLLPSAVGVVSAVASVVAVSVASVGTDFRAYIPAVSELRNMSKNGGSHPVGTYCISLFATASDNLRKSIRV